jgi:hypothetical protein
MKIQHVDYSIACISIILTTTVCITGSNCPLGQFGRHGLVSVSDSKVEHWSPSQHFIITRTDTTPQKHRETGTSSVTARLGRVHSYTSLFL